MANDEKLVARVREMLARNPYAPACREALKAEGIPESEARETIRRAQDEIRRGKKVVSLGCDALRLILEEGRTLDPADAKYLAGAAVALYLKTLKEYDWHRKATWMGPVLALSMLVKGAISWLMRGAGFGMWACAALATFLILFFTQTLRSRRQAKASLRKLETLNQWAAQFGWWDPMDPPEPGRRRFRGATVHVAGVP